MKRLKLKKRYSTIIALLLTGAIFLSAQTIRAEEMPLLPSQSSTNEEGFLPVQQVIGAQAAVQGLVNIRNSNEEFQNLGASETITADGTRIYYDESGRIDKFVKPNGRTIDYTYDFDEDGNLRKITISDGNSSVSFTSRQILRIKSEANDGSQEPVDETSPNEPSTRQNNNLYNPIGPPDEAEPFEEALQVKQGSSPIDLESIARNPIDPEDVGRFFDYLRDREIAASSKFYEGVDDYYDGLELELLKLYDLWSALESNSMDEEIKEAFEQLKKNYDLEANLKTSDDLEASLDIDLEKNKIGDSNLVNNESQKDLLDALLEHVYSKTLEDGREKEIIERFIHVEEMLRKLLLIPDMEIYKAEIQEGVGMFYELAEDILTKSPGAVFVNKDGKIRAIIMLPAKEEDIQEE